MKAIKKIAVAVAIAVVASSASFAVDYSGDVQLQLGWQGATTTTDAPDGNAKFLSNGGTLGVANWNLFNINSVFSVGVFEKLDLGFGFGATGMSGHGSSYVTHMRVALDFLFGPAVGIRAGDIVKFQIGMGLASGYEGIFCTEGATESNAMGGVIGFGFDLQAKFRPRSTISPLIGFQYTIKGMGEYTTESKFGGFTTRGITESPIKAHSYALYVGAGYNLGIR